MEKYKIVCFFFITRNNCKQYNMIDRDGVGTVRAVEGKCTQYDGGIEMEVASEPYSITFFFDYTVFVSAKCTFNKV